MKTLTHKKCSSWVGALNWFFFRWAGFRIFYEYDYDKSKVTGFGLCLFVPPRERRNIWKHSFYLWRREKMLFEEIEEARLKKEKDEIAGLQAELILADDLEDIDDEGKA